MGWLSTTKHKSTWAHVQEHVIGYGKDVEIVKHSTRGGVYYLAIRTIESGEVWGLVVLTESDRASREIRMKAIDEFMGPFYYNASAAVLDALSHTTNSNAIAWRDRCRQRAPLQNKDLRGLRVRLYGQEYYVLGKGHPTARSYQVRHVATGLYYRLKSSQIKDCEFIG
jgi:hypothetical protein